MSIPASELEMSAEDQSDYDAFKKLLDRLGKAVIMSAEAETSEIIRRRLFEWDGTARRRQETVAIMPSGSWTTGSRSRLVPHRPRPRGVRGDVSVPSDDCCRCSSGNGRRCPVSSRPAACCGCWPCGCPRPTRRASRVPTATR